MELDICTTGKRYFGDGLEFTWLIFNSQRHKLRTTPYTEGLFEHPPEQVELSLLLDQVERGPDLADDLCLVSLEGDKGIHLVTGWGYRDIRRHHIASWETFVKLGFKQSLVRSIPRLVFWAIAPGLEIAEPTDAKGT